MKKNLVIADERFQEEFMNIFAIGLTCCLEKGLIDTIRAEQWLFSPILANNMKQDHYSNEFLSAMEYASELDATKDSTYHMKSILTAQDLFCTSLAHLEQHSYDERDHLIYGMCDKE